ncbi:sterol desaturase family protein [Aspergillus ruber CBS 135680]|uniref:Sterol desaturase n=1 Tax=Aspergillus ruber (strain CBS 135680) TaxID=1388766 RepID=A0A017S2Y1_ASPRC|nr:sterol desaturase [Aspergillus ruber CBS 135680]EYE91312.1 sterol desaturase [Aspergillus ruber CBS 135680]
MDAWANIVESYSPRSIEFIGTLLVQLLTFWLPSLYYLSLDALFPSFSQRHKIQPAPKQPTGKDIWHCVAVVARNQLLSTALHFLLITATTYAGLPSSYRIETTLPTLFEFFRDFIISLFLREALFYYSHRFLHRPYFYVRIHKQHHRFTAPIALAAQYAHPIEQIFANILPITLPPQILKSHIFTFWAFLGYELFGTATVHSGYDFLGGQARMHDLHHEKFNLNYGSMGVLDWVHGTDRLRKRE